MAQNNPPIATPAMSRRKADRLERFESQSPGAGENQKPGAALTQSLNAHTLIANNDCDLLDDVITRGTEGTSFSTLESASSRCAYLNDGEDAIHKPQSPHPASNRASESCIKSPQTQAQTQTQAQAQTQQQFSSRSVNLRVSRAQARRANRRNRRTSTSPCRSLSSGSTSLSPTAPRSQLALLSNASISVQARGGSVMLVPDLDETLDGDDGNQRVGDDLVGASITSRARDSTASARSRDSAASNLRESAIEQPPPEYRIDPEKEGERPTLPAGDEGRPGAFAIPRRAFGGVPAWFDEALQRRRQPQNSAPAVQRVPRSNLLTQVGNSARSLSARSLNSSARRLSASLRELSSLQVFARLHDSNVTDASSATNDNEEITTEDLQNSKSSVQQAARWSSVLDASCMNLVAEQESLDFDEEESKEDSKPPSSQRGSLRGSMPEVLSKATKPLVKIVKSPIDLFRQRSKPIKRSNSADI